MKYDLKKARVAVIGMGYVGAPLAVALAKYHHVIGYDINQKRVKQLQESIDLNGEISQDSLRKTRCVFTAELHDIVQANIYIVATPTPIDSKNIPDLTIIKKVTQDIASILCVGDIVVYESTVYPGVTEDICGPILEKTTSLKSGEDFILGYSPERICPGIGESIENMTKVVVAQTAQATDFLAQLYGAINNHQIYKAKTIKVAEASKAVENAQIDINVAFINEMAMMLNKLDISIYDVLETAGTKQNFLPFQPGLVGGHCIGVDPYYLVKNALDNGYRPEMLLAGRKINDNMGKYTAERVHQHLNSSENRKAKQKILILGFTFKENIRDIRNTKIIDIITLLQSKGYEVDVHDPYAYPQEVKDVYGLSIMEELPKHKDYDGLVLAVKHTPYKNMDTERCVSFFEEKAGKGTALIYDVKGVWKEKKFPSSISYKTS